MFWCTFVSWHWRVIFFRQICNVNYRLPLIEFGIFIYLLCFHMKQPRKMKIAELQYPKSIWWWAKPSNKLIFCKEAYLIVKIKSSEKKLWKAAYFFPNFISIKHMLSWLMTSAFVAPTRRLTMVIKIVYLSNVLLSINYFNFISIDNLCVINH